MQGIKIEVEEIGSRAKAVEILARTRSARAFQPRLCFFAVTSVTRRGGSSEEKEGKIRWGVQQKGRRKIAFFKGAALGF